MPEDNMDFTKEVLATASDKFHIERITAGQLTYVLANCIRSLEFLDHVKKAVFYNREVGDGPKQIPRVAAGIIGLDRPPEGSRPVHMGDVPVNVFHAIIGSATEAGEKLEMLLNALTGHKPFDFVNYVEEVGDGLYYDALGLDHQNLTLEDAEIIVIRKLRKRSGKTFSADAFNNRDVDAERAVLETGVETAASGKDFNTA